ncbi:lantibiotic dehydratase [Mesoterricola silvestris]|uniref:Lantibiotic dehydratase n=1 Tax=Mesoterricola silvestris TaxID=2927979 RepID=A0AA48H6K7_9BACT|nr:lantibiotic dehydratase [Mesoterricola silvestris]BDU72783.1 lantibiotic dehydratase [Mesoterricola silvestris]
MPSPTVRTAPFFVLRTPGLPVDPTRAWTREHLAAAVRRPEIREALFLASPDLDTALDPWLRGDLPEARAQRVDQSLVRYLTRMGSRSTPFGLFAGCGVGAWGPVSDLRVPPLAQCVRRTRLDNDYLAALVADLERNPEVRGLLTWRPNTSLHLAAGRWHYAEPRLGAGEGREYHLVALEPTGHLDKALACAAGGAGLGSLAGVLAQAVEVEPGEASGFLDELVEGRILTSDLEPAVTGEEPLQALAGHLKAQGGTRPLGERLERIVTELGELDEAGAGAAPGRYRALARELEALAVPADPRRLFQVDLHKPSEELHLGPEVRRALEEAVERLRLITPHRRESPLDRFRDAFRERYGTRAVPLLEALDAEAGIGFGPKPPPGLDGSPLLQGLPFQAAAQADPPFTARDRHILKRLHFLGNAPEWALDDADLAILGEPGPRPFPATFSALAALASPSPEALARGDFQVLMESYSGPSGAQLLGRFCLGDPRLASRVEELLRVEEARRPEAVFAEIVHQPDGRIGNIIARPRLRAFEIPFLGSSGAPLDHQIPPADLTLALEGDRLVLRSIRLGREVVPRMATAHNYAQGLPVFRFLAHLQEQDGRAGGWTWGPLEALPFLPRVTRGRHVLCRARWRVEARELEAGGLQALRAPRRLPRHVVLEDADSTLWVDLDDPLRAATLEHIVASRPSFTLVEAFPGPEELAAAGPEGRYFHELVIPFQQKEPPLPARRSPRPSSTAEAARSYPPGSEWLYIKVYAGPAASDRILAVLLDTLRRITVQAWDRWFFVRYADPESHLRLRFHGTPTQLTSNLLPLIRRILAPHLKSGACWKVQVDTYERELERYGGLEGMLLAEAWFEQDSEKALDLLHECDGEEGSGLRWQRAFKAMDELLSGLGLSLTAKLRIVDAIRGGLGREFNPELGIQLGERYRSLRRDLEAWIPVPGRPAPPALPDPRLHRQRTCLHRLAEAASHGRLSLPLEDLAASLVHMQVNRFMRGSHRAHELVLADFLGRVYRSQLARVGRARDKMEG